MFTTHTAKSRIHKLTLGILCTAFLFALQSPAMAGDAISILKYHPDKKGNVVGFKSNGKMIGKINVDQLPKLPTKATGYDKKTNRIKLHTDQGDVWLMAMQVETSRKATIKPGCTTPQNSIGRSHVSRGLGDKSGC